MKEKNKIPREIALEAAKEFLGIMRHWIKTSTICGSIRRKKEFVHDIDIVLIPKSRWTFRNEFTRRFKAKKYGESIIETEYNGIQIDIYLANSKTYETLRLIRTGSTAHNIKLCSTAKKKGWKLKASGQGLFDEKGKLIDNTERGILEKLLGEYVEPEDREK